MPSKLHTLAGQAVNIRCCDLRRRIETLYVACTDIIRKDEYDIGFSALNAAQEANTSNMLTIVFIY